MKERFAGWHILFFQYMKRDWKKAIVWILGLGLFASVLVPFFEEIAKGEGLLGIYEAQQNPAVISMVGPTPIENAGDYTLGAMYVHEMLLFCGLFALIIAVLHVIGHTRREEDLGLTELIRSYQIGRQANSLAVIAETVVINILLAFLISGVLMSFGVDALSLEGSLLFGASIGMAGVIGAVIALIMAQVMPSSSGAVGSSIGLIGLFYIIRAGTDVANVNLSVFNPLGWIYLTYPFTENNWTLLIYALIFSVLLISISFVLEGRRDMGEGYIPERLGRGYARKSLLSVRGLFTKINKGSIISWLIAFIIMGAVYGSIYEDMQDFVESNDIIKQMFTQTDMSIETSFTSTIMVLMIGLVSILPIVIINKLFSEERRSHLSQLLATKVTRGEVYWTNIGLAIFAGVLGILMAAGGLGITAITVMDDDSSLSIIDFLAAGYNFLPSVLFFIGLSALALGFLSNMGKIVYIYLGYSFLLNYIDGIVDFPEWFTKTAIQSWFPQMPSEDFSILIFTTITVISLAMMIIGYIGYSRRDMMEGA